MAGFADRKPLRAEEEPIFADNDEITRGLALCIGASSRARKQVVSAGSAQPCLHIRNDNPAQIAQSFGQHDRQMRIAGGLPEPIAAEPEKSALWFTVAHDSERSLDRSHKARGSI